MNTSENGPDIEINLDDTIKKFGAKARKQKRRQNRRKRKVSSTPPDYKKTMLKGTIFGLIATLIAVFFCFFVLLVPFNIKAGSFWFMIILALILFAAVRTATIAGLSTGYENEIASGTSSWNSIQMKSLKLILLPLALIGIAILISISSSSIFHASAYASILKVQDAVFADDLQETLNSDSIALMDTASAKMLGDREIGSLSSVVSQYDVSEDYTQIDLNGKPKKVAALDYAGFFKWIGNRSEGVPGFVTVDPVSMSASYQQCENGMIYVPSAYILEDADRYVRMHFPTLMVGSVHFEIDEDGDPYYVASVYDHTIMLFGGKTVTGAIILDPVTGDIQKYNLADVPQWVDVVYDGNLICEQYNWFGTLKNGFFNSLISKKGCNQVTTYYSSDGDESDDDVPVSDYGYVAKDGDIWIYTGVTSVNGDSSNIGFLLANERTGEAHYYNIAGADEKSAMAAAEGEVQEKGYQASFPSLINVDGCPTYIMVLKDASGLVKLYATVNVEQYNLVTTASTQKECISKYRQLLGLAESGEDVTQDDLENDPDANNGAASADDTEEVLEATDEADITIADIKYIDVNGNTYIYLITDDDQIYKAKASTHENMLLLNTGDTVHITYADNMIVTCE